MFTQRCFIRKNTKELRHKLTDLGLKKNNLDDFKQKWLAVNYGMYISVSEGFEKIHENDIDCGENEDLFLAIAALRNDTDKNQWFIYPNIDRINFNKKTPDIIVGYNWYFSMKNDILSEVKNKINNGVDPSILPHKATVEELIEHFKNKKQIK